MSPGPLQTAWIRTPSSLCSISQRELSSTWPCFAALNRLHVASSIASNLSSIVAVLIRASFACMVVRSIVNQILPDRRRAVNWKLPALARSSVAPLEATDLVVRVTVHQLHQLATGLLPH